MKKTEHIYDCIILGAGSAGIRAQKHLSRHTKNFIVLDPGPLGTTCARVGCMPSKSFLSAPHLLETLEHFTSYGLESNPALNTKRWMTAVRAQRDNFAQGMVDQVLDLKRKYQPKSGLILDSNHVLVEEKILKTKTILIATGTRATWPAWTKELFSHKAARKRMHDEQTFFEQKNIDGSWAIIGGGAIGFEMGLALHQLDKRSLLFTKAAKVPSLTSPTLQSTALPYFLERGLKIENVEEAKFLKEKFVLKTNQASYRFDQIFLSTGRSSNWETIFLEPQDYTTENKLKFDTETLKVKSLKSDQGAIFVAGDATGQTGLLHESIRDAETAAENIILFLKNKPLLKRPLRPHFDIIFSHAQIGKVGKSFKELEQNKNAFSTIPFEFVTQGRANTERQAFGGGEVFHRNGLILGVEMWGLKTEHFLHFFQAAIQWKKTLDDLGELNYYHPTFEEVIKKVVKIYQDKKEKGIRRVSNS